MQKNIAMEQKGRSMIEMLGVLAIVGVLSVAGIAGYSKAMGKFKINKAMDQVSTLSSNIKTMYANAGSYKTVSNSEAISLTLFPEEMTKGCTISNGVASDASTCVRSGINGQVTIDKGDDNGNTFTVKFDAVSKDACTAFASGEWGGSSGFSGLAIGTGDSALVSITSSTKTSDIFSATAKCASCAAGSCSATWTFL